MKLENQVCSLSLAKELMGGGYKQEGLWWWHWLNDKRNKPYLHNVSRKNGWTEPQNCAVAPTVAELLEKMPNNVRIDKQTYGEKYSVYDWEDVIRNATDYETVVQRDNRASDCLAKMWLYLKKEGLI